MLLNIQEALTGKWPYDHIRTENAVLTAIMIKKELPARPDVIRAGSKNGDEVWSLLRSCWAYELEERPKSKEILETVSTRFHTYTPSRLPLITRWLGR